MKHKKISSEVDKLCAILKKHNVKQFVSPEYTILFNEHVKFIEQAKKPVIPNPMQQAHFNHMPSAIDFLGEIK